MWDLAKDRLHQIKEFNPAATKAITWKDLAAAVDIGTAKPTDLLALGSDQYTVVTAAPEVLDGVLENGRVGHQLRAGDGLLARRPVPGDARLRQPHRRLRPGEQEAEVPARRPHGGRAGGVGLAGRQADRVRGQRPDGAHLGPQDGQAARGNPDRFVRVLGLFLSGQQAARDRRQLLRALPVGRQGAVASDLSRRPGGSRTWRSMRGARCWSRSASSCTSST